MNLVIGWYESTLSQFRRAAKLAGVSIALGLAAYIPYRLHGMGFQTRVNLPRVSAGEVRDASNWHVVHLTAAGEVLYEGRPHTLDELEEVLESDARQVLLCADRESTALNFLYLASVIVGREPPRWSFFVAVNDGWRQAVLTVHAGPHPTALSVSIWADSRVPVPLADHDRWFEMGWRPWEGNDPADLEDEIEDIRDETEAYFDEHEDAWPTSAISLHGMVLPTAQVPFQWVAEGLGAFHGAGAETLWVRSISAHPWVRRQPILERPAWALYRGRLDAGPGISVELPVAPRAERGTFDSQADFGITVTADGRLYRGINGPLTLAEFRHKLENAVRITKRRLKDIGKQKFDAVAGLRIDKAAPWQHVEWVLSMLRKRDVIRIEFEALPDADLSYGESEAKALGVKRASRIPMPGNFDAVDLPILLAREDRIPTDTLPVSIRRAADGSIRYDVAGTVATSAGDLSFPPDTDVAFDVEPAVPAKYVIAALSRLDPELRIYFVGDRTDPPESAEHAPTLPRPADARR